MFTTTEELEALTSVSQSVATIRDDRGPVIVLFRDGISQLVYSASHNSFRTNAEVLWLREQTISSYVHENRALGVSLNIESADAFEICVRSVEEDPLIFRACRIGPTKRVCLLTSVFPSFFRVLYA